MGALTASLFTTVDGVVEAPHEFHFPYFDERMGEIMTAYTERCEAYLMGRGLYEEWAAYWPGNTTDDFGEFINPVAKYVLSNSLGEATWQNTTLVSGSEDEVAARVAEIKDGVPGDIGMSGSGTTVRWLLGRGLLDRVELFVDPVVVGRGARLFDGDPPRKPLALVSSEALPTGVLHLVYAPA